MKTFPIVSLIVALAVIAAGFFFGTRFLNESVLQEDGGDVAGSEKALVEYSPEKIFVLRSSDGEHHIYEGVITLPSPCHTLKTSISISESAPEEVVLRFETATNAEICAQVLKNREFAFEFDAHPNHAVSAEINGSPVILDILESNDLAEPPQSPSDIEVIP